MQLESENMTETEKERQKRLDELHRRQTGMLMMTREDMKRMGAKRICPKCGYRWDLRAETRCPKCGTE